MERVFGGQTGASASFYDLANNADLSSSRPSGRSPLPSSPLSSPIINNAAVIPPTIHDHIAEWFHRILNHRKLVASCVSATVGSFLFIALVALLQASIFSPLTSITGALSTLVTVSVWTVAIVVWAVHAFAIGFATFNFAKPDIPRRVNVFRAQPWISVASYAIAHMITIGCTYYLTGCEWNRPTLQMIAWSTVLCALHSVFGLDHRLIFSSQTSDLWRTLRECFSTTGESALRQALHDMFILYRTAIALGTITGCVTAGISTTFLTLINPLTHLHIVLLTLIHTLLTRIVIRVVREVVMKPVSFPLPPPHVVRSPTPAQTRTLVNVLDANDVTLKLFGFTDLCRLARGGGERRQEIFTLSQPGGHPRNWTSVSAAALQILQDAKTKIECATRQLPGGAAMLAWNDEDEEGVDRKMLLMPEGMRQQVYSSAVRSRHRATLLRPTPIPSRPSAPPKPSTIQMIKRFVELPTGVVSKHEALMVQLAAESLFLLVVASFDEDRYGVVQRDLSKVLSTLLHLSTAIDHHFRARNSRASTAEEDQPLVGMDESVHTAVYRVKQRFGDTLRSIGLSKDELTLLESMS